MRGRSSNTMKFPVREKHRRKILRFTANRAQGSLWPARSPRRGRYPTIVGPRRRPPSRRRAKLDHRIRGTNNMQTNAGKKKQKCKNCEGKGTLKKGDKVVRCQRCDGTGIKRRLHGLSQRRCGAPIRKRSKHKRTRRRL